MIKSTTVNDKEYCYYKIRVLELISDYPQIRNYINSVFSYRMETIIPSDWKLIDSGENYYDSERRLSFLNDILKQDLSTLLCIYRFGQENCVEFIVSDNIAEFIEYLKTSDSINKPHASLTVITRKPSENKMIIFGNFNNTFSSIYETDYNNFKTAMLFHEVCDNFFNDKMNFFASVFENSKYPEYSRLFDACIDRMRDI